ncbi:MAG: RagB/SusD family nutrient uptake outer membrane protein [Cyclobacteriaceae bacterium]
MNYTKYISLSFTVFILLIFSSACDNEEFFELERPVEDPWLTLADFEKAPIGAYYASSGNGGGRTIFGHGRMAGELFADGVNIAPPTAGFEPNGDAEDMYARTTEVPIGIFDNGVFNSGYFAVGLANGGLDYVEENNGRPLASEGRQDEVDRIAGELHFVRAYAYYWLTRIYMPPYPSDEKRIPFRLEQADNFSEAITSELASTNDLYGVIVEDLRAAKDLLPERYEEGVHNSSYADGRANKFAAAALLAKVLFHMGPEMRDEALAELNFVIDQNGGDYTLEEDPIEAYNKTGIARGSEVIWYYALWAGDGLGGSSNWKHPNRFQDYNASNRQASGPETNQNRYMTASKSFLQQVGWEDASGELTAEALQDKRFNQLFLRLLPSAQTDTIAENIYPEPNGNFATTEPYIWNNRYYRAGDRVTNLPLLRLADMYLLRAIIRAQSGDVAGGRADLNMVRNRAGIGDFAGSDAQLEEAIHLERFKEMAFEGDRLYYLQGLRVDIPAGERGGATVPWDSPFYSEIPDYETDINQAFN